MEELSFDNILGEQEIETLFTDPEDNDVQEEHKETEEEEVETPDDKKQKEKDKSYSGDLYCIIFTPGRRSVGLYT